MSYIIEAVSRHARYLKHKVIGMTTRDEFPDITERLKEYEIIWSKSGTLSLELNLKTYVIRPGEICCLAPGQIRRLIISEDAWGEYLSLDADYFYRICTEIKFPLITLDSHHLGKPMLIMVKQNWEQESNDILQKIRALCETHEVPEDLLNVWLRLFMLYLKKHLDVQAKTEYMSRDMELINKFMALLSRNYVIKKMVADYALELHVTPNYLNQIVKRVSGFSASHHIQQFLILEAKRQALVSKRSMKQIAYNLGFDDIAHFSKFFKSKAGTNFTDFKKGIISTQF